MKDIIALIKKKEQEFADLPLFHFMKDTSIDPSIRLSWIPGLTHLPMGFKDLSKHNFRKEPTNDPIQEIINIHTYEEDDHSQWFLEDLDKVVLNQSFKLSDSIRFLWSEETYKTRLICRQIAMYTFQAEPAVVLAAIEAIEATAHVTFAVTTQVTQELQKITNQDFRYFGQYHLSAETEHCVKITHLHELIRDIQLTREQKAKAFEVVEKIFEIFSESMDEMMAYVKKRHGSKIGDFGLQKQEKTSHLRMIN
ncbi:hypothetical protein NIES4103_24640 [Nostoc sp. NIES-4103]|nr:hypothetical protein NIES4103_24640 [Nostoc sp. NIES-4103]